MTLFILRQLPIQGLYADDAMTLIIVRDSFWRKPIKEPAAFLGPDDRECLADTKAFIDQTFSAGIPERLGQADPSISSAGRYTR